MKLYPDKSAARRTSGIFIIECVVYIAVFAILLGGATTVFYYCWEHTDAVIGATDEISSALRTGERWRADVRAATGKITVQTDATGEWVRIPQGGREIFYRFESGEISRQFSATARPLPLLTNVKASQMAMDTGGGVTAWRWELELASHHRQTRLPLRFTFEAVAPAKP